MPSTLKLAIVGDVVPGPPMPESASVARAVSLLQTADIAFGNLETAVSSRGARVEKLYHMRVAPSTLVELTRMGFSVMSVANNHTLDYGLEGFTDTLSLLREKGILSASFEFRRAKYDCE